MVKSLRHTQSRKVHQETKKFFLIKITTAWMKLGTFKKQVVEEVAVEKSYFIESGWSWTLLY